jgi:hypothetical protein
MCISVCVCHPEDMLLRVATLGFFILLMRIVNLKVWDYPIDAQ